jgi:HEAT repeat protein
MFWPRTLGILFRLPDSRPTRVVEQEILDELEFHVEMRTLDNVSAGMTADEARQDAIRRFGDFQRIHKACRQTLLGERLMLQRLQAVMTLVLLGAVIFLGVEFYRGRRANEAATALMIQKSDAATARMMQSLEKLAERPAGNPDARVATRQPAAAAVSPQFEALEPSALDQLFPRDAKLTDVQRGFRNWSEETFPALDAAWWQSLGATDKAAWEKEWLKKLSSGSEQNREVAIRCLAGAGCKKAVSQVLKIAAERVEKDNADRCEAARALGILGDRSLVPELVPLTYHYNMNTRLWAQISLVRLTGENFGRDVAAWKAWWEKQGGKPPIDAKPVVWATSEEMLQYADPKKQDEVDRQLATPSQSTRFLDVQHSPPPAATPTRLERPHDDKLNKLQRFYRDKTEETFQESLYHDVDHGSSSEERCIKLLSDDEQTRIAAINGLTVLGSRKAVPGLLKIAAQRAEKDNRDRWMAVRALGIIGDASVVPELVHLTYHYNQNTRFWAQISLVRLTGENFGRDVAAWKAWWEKQGKRPPIDAKPVVWATSPEMLPYADPKRQDEMDRQLAE